MGRMDGKVAIVTGSSSGLGRTLAVALAEEGAMVMCSDIRKSPLSGEIFESNIDTDDYIEKKGGKAGFQKCDVSSLKQCHNLVEATVKKFGKLDVIVNNAGIFTRLARLHELDESDWDKTMNVNAKGIYNGSHAAITYFLKEGKGGNIVNICSIGGLTGLKEEAAYVASKFASVGLTKQIAVDYGRDSIRVNGICPNYMPTPMCVEFFKNKDFMDSYINITPLGRAQDTKDIVGALLFLATDDSAYMTGQLVVVDGGVTARIQSDVN